MEIALINGVRSRPQPGLGGVCQSCGQAMVAKCGSQLIWHWSHRGRRYCDPWWENETDWHREWKSHFPEHMHEVVHFDAVTGEKHIADVKTDLGMVIEIQHSAMPIAELQAREAFYKKMIWIVDGRAFSNQFQVLPHPLPHPGSKMLDDMVFGISGSAYWRRSENEEGASMVLFHRAEEIADQIQQEYRGHHFLAWKRPREVWLNSSTPVFMDFGGQTLFRIGRYPSSDQWCVQRLSKRSLIEKNGGAWQPPTTHV